MDNKFLPI